MFAPGENSQGFGSVMSDSLFIIVAVRKTTVPVSLTVSKAVMFVASSKATVTFGVTVRLICVEDCE